MMTKFNLQAGFHIIEILITLSLTAIMSHWMLGKYQTFIAETRRREAQQGLFTLASVMEDYAIQHRGYGGATMKKLHTPAKIAGKNYELVIVYANTNDYLISARPLGRQAIVDARCGILSLSSTGESRVSGSGGHNQCW